jgi:uncharacterized protein (DUF1697 family)
MAELKNALQSGPFSGAKTLLASGNLVLAGGWNRPASRPNLRPASAKSSVTTLEWCVGRRPCENT